MYVFVCKCCEARMDCKTEPKVLTANFDANLDQIKGRNLYCNVTQLTERFGTFVVAVKPGGANLTKCVLNTTFTYFRTKNRLLYLCNTNDG
jgi:hypothetical protein